MKEQPVYSKVISNQYMGHCVYLNAHHEEEEDELFSAKNFLPFFWVSLLNKRHIEDVLPSWLHYEALCTDETREEELERYTDIWPSPCSIKINKEEVIRNTAIAADFFRQAIPSYTRLYNDFIQHVLDRLPATGDYIHLDIISIAGFSDVPVFSGQLEKMIGAISGQDIEALGTLDADPVTLTGFPEAEKFNLEQYPELKPLKDKQRKQFLKSFTPADRRIKQRKHYGLLIAGIIFGLLFIYAGVRGYRKEGLAFNVILVNVLGWLSFAAGLYGLFRKGK
jgi:hypothetical protein